MKTGTHNDGGVGTYQRHLVYIEGSWWLGFHVLVAGMTLIIFLYIDSGLILCLLPEYVYI